MKVRLIYSLLWWLALPLVLARLWLRGRQEPGYRQHWLERLGWYGNGGAPLPQAKGPTLWVHAVSVGETRAAEPLIDALLLDYPDSRIVLTHMTPTGRAAGKELYARHGARLVQSYLPYDTGTMVRRFIDHFQPTMCLLMETEVWPNLIAVCANRRVPVVLVNARLSERSLRKAQRLGVLMQDAAQGITLVAAQTETDGERASSLGAPQVAVTGSIKFDVTPPQAALATGTLLRGRIGARRVLLCASTREGEEILILDAFVRAALPADVLLVIVPRHPQRFDDIAALIEERGLTLLRRSQMTVQESDLFESDAVESGPAGSDLAGPSLSLDVQVLLGDSMGEMFAYCAVCDCAFIGGSLLPLGGQNLIEACALGKPVLVGPDTFNFALVTEEAIACGAALRVPDADHLMLQCRRLLEDDVLRAAMGKQALRFSTLHRGATLRTLALLQPLIGPQR
jgi:3-deoxy-D-manno-octulosonic-acid transferase